MTPDDPDVAVLDLPPEQLDGHTIDDLQDYLDRGRAPADPSIDGSPACRRALSALARLEEISRLVAAEDAAAQPAVEEGWTRMLLQQIDVDAHAGADFPIDADGAGDVVMTEGALRGLVRAVGDGVPGLLIGRVRFRGPLDSAAPAAVTIDVDVDVVQGFVIPDTVPALRTAIRERIGAQTRIRNPVVDVTVRDLLVQRAEEGS